MSTILSAESAVRDTIRQGLDPRAYAEGLAGFCRTTKEAILAEIERQQPTPPAPEDLARERDAYCRSYEAIRATHYGGRGRSTTCRHCGGPCADGSGNCGEC